MSEYAEKWTKKEMETWAYLEKLHQAVMEAEEVFKTDAKRYAARVASSSAERIETYAERYAARAASSSAERIEAYAKRYAARVASSSAERIEAYRDMECAREDVKAVREVLHRELLSMPFHSRRKISLKPLR